MGDPIIKIIDGRRILTVDLGPAPLWWYRSYVNGSDGSVVTECGPVERMDEPVRVPHPSCGAPRRAVDG